MMISCELLLLLMLQNVEGTWVSADGDARRVAIASIELCFICSGSGESRGWTGSGVDCNGRRLMVAAVAAVSGCMPSKFGWRTWLGRRMADWMLLGPGVPAPP